MRKLRRIKIIAIVGPTASGKSELAVALAKRFNGEIISADSRQVYRGLDIGTGKVPGRWKKMKLQNGETREVFIYKGIPHYCIDFVSPKKVFTVIDFKKCADAAIRDISARGKIPILCGGTGFYTDTVINNTKLPDVPPDKKLRKELSKKTTEELFKILKKLDARRAKTIDRHNPYRLIRAIEIVKSGKNISKRNSENPLGTLVIGIKPPKDVLYGLIDTRLEKRISEGLIEEVKKLLKNGIPNKRLYALGLEYRYVSLLLRKKMAKKEMVERLKIAIRQYSKRQMTWFRRNENIHWIQTGHTGEKSADILVKNFLALRTTPEEF